MKKMLVMVLMLVAAVGALAEGKPQTMCPVMVKKSTKVCMSMQKVTASMSAAGDVSGRLKLIPGNTFRR